jgi:hypothetical protein
MAILGFLMIGVLAFFFILFLIRLWENAKDTSNRSADIKNGKGVFLTFNYSPEEWEYFTQNLVLSGKQGKAFFGKKLILLADGTEDVITELFDLNPLGKRLQQVKIDEEFLVFSIKYRDVTRSDIAGDPYLVKSETDEFQILIPAAQADDANRLLDFYQKLITQNNDKGTEMIKNQ